MNDLAVLDSEALDRLREWGGDDLVVKMLDLFMEHGPERVAQIRSGVETGSLEETQRGAHSLKSSAGNLGARRLQAGAARLEGLADEGDLDAVEELLPELEREFREAKRSLEEVLRTLSSP
ncbi:MAG: Hpt domain-containing protein [Gemmatimonadota bacterium]